MATGVAVSGMEGVRKARGWLLGLGIVLILVGTLALGAAVFATIASVIFFGWLLLVAGAIEVGYAFSQPKWGGLILHVVNGVLGVVAGFILVLHPAAGLYRARATFAGDARNPKATSSTVFFRVLPARRPAGTRAA